MKHLTRSGDSCISKRGGGERERGRVGEWESGRRGEEICKNLCDLQEIKTP